MNERPHVEPIVDPAHPFGPVVAQFDDSVERLLDRLRGRPVPDRLFYSLSALADMSLLWVLAAAARGLRPGPRRPDLAFATMAGLGIESLVVNQGVKRLFRRHRPHHHDEQPHALRRPTTSSFPSGHATSAFFAATVFTADTPRQAPVWFGLATLVALSRPYVRVHHASDVVAGAGIGMVAGTAALAGARRVLGRRRGNVARTT